MHGPDTTFNLDKAMPKDIKTKNIVAYVSKKVVFLNNQVHPIQNIKI